MPLTPEEIRKAYNEDDNLGFFEKIKKVLFSPSEFFEAVKAEQGLKSAFVYLAIISLIGVSLVAILLFLFLGLMLSFLGSLTASAGISADQFTGFITGMSLVYLGAIILGLWLATLLLSFIGAGILHIFVKIVGGKGSYSDTYKAVAYASTPSYLFIWVPVVGLFISIWALYLEIKGLSVLHNISMKRALLAIILLIVIVFVLIFGIGVFLYSFGVLNPTVYTLSRCSGFQYFAFQDQKLTETEYSIVLLNDNRDVEITGINVNGQELTISKSEIRVGSMVTLKGTGFSTTKKPSDAFSYIVTITYNSDGITDEKDTATCTGLVQTQLENVVQSQIANMGKQITIDNTVKNEITIHNVGTYNISTDELSVYVDAVKTVCSWDTSSFGPDKLATCTLPEPCSGKIVKISAPGNFDSVVCE